MDGISVLAGGKGAGVLASRGVHIWCSLSAVVQVVTMLCFHPDFSPQKSNYTKLQFLPTCMQISVDPSTLHSSHDSPLSSTPPPPPPPPPGAYSGVVRWVRSNLKLATYQQTLTELADTRDQLCSHVRLPKNVCPTP